MFNQENHSSAYVYYTIIVMFMMISALMWKMLAMTYNTKTKIGDVEKKNEINEQIIASLRKKNTEIEREIAEMRHLLCEMFKKNCAMFDKINSDCSDNR